MSDYGNDDYTTPLTKQKQKQTKKTDEPINVEPINVEPDKPIKKVRKPKTQKQLDQFKKVVEARKNNIDKRIIDKKIEASKFLLSQGLPIEKPKEKPKIIKKNNDLHESDTDSSDEQVIIIKKKKKKKKKIIVMEDTDSETDSDSDTQPPQPPNHTSRSFKNQQNKKSIITIHDKPENKKPLINNYKNYFV